MENTISPATHTHPEWRMAAIQKDSENDDGKVFTVDLEMVDRHPKLKEKIPRNMRFDLRETSEGEVQIAKYHSYCALLEIPSEIEHDGKRYSVTSIGDGAIAWSSIDALYIPDSVRTVGDRAMADCRNLSWVKIGNSVTSIGKYAFSSCPELKSVEVPDSVRSVGDGAFAFCNGLERVSIGTGLESIGEIPFLSDSGLKGITVSAGNPYYASADGVLFTKDMRRLIRYPPGRKGPVYEIPKGVTHVEGSAFESCKGLEQLDIPDSVMYMGDGTFRGSGIGCFSVSENNTSYRSADGIIFSKDMKELVAFPPRSKIREYNVPDPVTSIGDCAFATCEGLESVRLPGSLESIGTKAFADCYLLQMIELPETLRYIGERAFMHCTALESVSVPDPVTSIGEETFCGCCSLRWLRLSRNLTEIGRCAFQMCGTLESLDIPNSVKCIGDRAFDGCESLKGTVTIPEGVIDMGEGVFGSISKMNDIEVICPPHVKRMSLFSFEDQRMVD